MGFRVLGNSGQGRGWPGCWVIVPDLAIFCHSMFRRRFGSGCRRNLTTGGVEEVVVF
jgi:hypothetical protein